MEDYFYLSKAINEANKHKTFKAQNAGLNSTERKNIKRVGKVCDFLQELNSWNLKEGAEFFNNIEQAIRDFMELNGYEFYIDNRDNCAFRSVKK